MKLNNDSFQHMIPPDGDRIKFRRLTMEDAWIWEEFIMSDKATEYFSLPKEREESTKWIKRQLNRYMDRGDGLLAVVGKSNDEFLGQCGMLWQEIDGEEVLEVGYSFLPRYWGRGYATESASLCYRHGFDLELSDFIVSIVHEYNIPSQQVASRNGLRLWKRSSWKEFPVQVWRIDKP